MMDGNRNPNPSLDGEKTEMNAGQLHPTRKLTMPIDTDFNWVRKQSIRQTVNTAITLSMGFGGVNTAVCIEQH